MIFIKTNLESCHLLLFKVEFWFTMWKWVNPCCQEQSAIAKGKQVLKFQHQMIFVGQGCFKNLLVILSCCRSSRSKNPDEFWTKFWYPRVSLPFLLLWHGFGISLQFQAHIMVQESSYYLPKQCATVYLIRNPSKLTYMWIKVSCWLPSFKSSLFSSMFFSTNTSFTGKPPTGPPFQEEGIHFHPRVGSPPSWSWNLHCDRCSETRSMHPSPSTPEASEETQRVKNYQPQQRVKPEGFLEQHIDICYAYIVIHIRICIQHR